LHSIVIAWEDIRHAFTGTSLFLFVFASPIHIYPFLIGLTIFLHSFTVVAGALFELVLYARGSYGGYPLLLLLRLWAGHNMTRRPNQSLLMRKDQ
jgi:hypothetical protein